MIHEIYKVLYLEGKIDGSADISVNDCGIYKQDNSEHVWKMWVQISTKKVSVTNFQLSRKELIGPFELTVINRMRVMVRRGL